MRTEETTETKRALKEICDSIRSDHGYASEQNAREQIAKLHERSWDNVPSGVRSQFEKVLGDAKAADGKAYTRPRASSKPNRKTVGGHAPPNKKS
jgi:hypothetical protein